MKKKIIFLAGLIMILFSFSSGSAQNLVNNDSSFLVTPDTLWFLTSEDFMNGKSYELTNPHPYPISISMLDQSGMPNCYCVGWYSNPYYSTLPVVIPAGGTMINTVRFFVSDNALPPVVYDTLKIGTGGFTKDVIVAADSFDILLAVHGKKNPDPGVMVYPNPFTNHFSILLNAKDSGPVSVFVLNPYNQKVIKILESNLIQGKNILNCDSGMNPLQYLPVGFYFLVIKQNTGTKLTKVLKVRN